MDKKEFCVLIKHCFLMGKSTVEAKQWLDKHYGDSAPGKLTVIDWYAEFKHGWTNTDDAEHPGHPKSAVVPENIKKVHKIVLKDREVKLREIADTLKISEGSVFTILHDNLSMRKLLSKWVLRFLTPDQKQQRINDSERCLELFKRDEKDLAPSDYRLFADIKKMLQEKKFGSNEEVIAKTEAYFESKDKSFYKKRHRKVKGELILIILTSECITREREYVDE
ncbi:protein GVQW3-like [Centruroides vittatus]|uniref:protein GVQW3-like n=1 Tax=Centruroides vittatus TaxID=120091 RepID=UPI00350F0D7B